MNSKPVIYLFLSFLLITISSCDSTEQNHSKILKDSNLEFVLDMVYNNPGEESTVSAYNDSEFVNSRGYNGMVAHWYVNCAINYDNFEKDIVAPRSDERKWIENQATMIDEKLRICDSTEMDVYAFTDIFVAPQSLWKKYGTEMGLQETNLHGYGGSVKNVRKPNIQSDIIRKLRCFGPLPGWFR